MSSSRERGIGSTILMLVGVGICMAAMVIEFNRAVDGHGRAWIYVFQWPLIGAFLVWIWWRYRNEGNVAKGFTQHYQDRVRQAQAEAEADDPDLRAWNDYVRRLDHDQN